MGKRKCRQKNRNTVVYASYKPEGGCVDDTQRWYSVVSTLKKTEDTVRGVMPQFDVIKKCITQEEALVGVIFEEYDLRIFLKLVESKPVLCFTIQVAYVRVNGYYGGQFVFTWVGDTSSLAGKLENTVYLKKLFSDDQETKIVVSEGTWCGVIEELVRMATGVEKKVILLIVSDQTSRDKDRTITGLRRVAVK